MSYTAPLDDIRFLLKTVADLPGLALLPGFEEAQDDMVDAILEESSRLSSEVFAPLNHSGDRQGSTLENGVVRTPDGFAAAYRQLVEGGWMSLPFAPDFGGQGLPWSVAIAVHEMWQSANLSLSLAPLLSTGAIELIQAHGTDEQKATYLGPMIAGDWSGTMNLTEPQAGSDVGALKTRARPENGHYRLQGQKIYITWGEHDCAENIVHLVLARTPEAPAGSRGISLFIVPKFLPNADGTLGARNDLRCVSLEHKLGIKASPTAVMVYGDNEGAIGYLVGEENQGMACMFTMMNNARLTVGLQGVAIAERAYQQARAFAEERRQGRPLEGPRDGPAVPIIEHSDVRRMLATMKSKTQAARALTLYTAACLDRGNREPDEARRRAADLRTSFLIPIVKAWCTDVGCEVSSLGVQVHGGMGFIEETGAAQHYRDARILPIYEGTNGIQALDLVSRKLLRDGGSMAEVLFEEIESDCDALAADGDPRLTAMATDLEGALAQARQATQWLLDQGDAALAHAAAAATPYCSGLGTLLAGWMLTRSARAARQALAEGTGDPEFLEGKIKLAHFFTATALPEVQALCGAAVQGVGPLSSLADTDL